MFQCTLQKLFKKNRYPSQCEQTLVMYYDILILLQFTKMVRVGDVFRHDSSCTAQTKFNSTGWVYIYLVVCAQVLYNVVMISYEFKCHEALNTIMACYHGNSSKSCCYGN